MKVIGLGTVIDRDFIINEHQVKELPTNWRKRQGIMFALTKGNPLIAFVDEHGTALNKEENQKRIDGEEEKEGEKGKGNANEDMDNHNDLLDNYLDQNTNSVLKAIKEDILPRDTLEKLIVIEKEDKNREKIIKALEDKSKGEQDGK